MDTYEYTAQDIHRPADTAEDTWQTTLVLARNQMRSKGWEPFAADHTDLGTVILYRKPAKTLRVVMSAPIRPA